MTNSDLYVIICLYGVGKREEDNTFILVSERKRGGTGGALGGRRRREYDAVLAGNLVLLYLYSLV